MAAIDPQRFARWLDEHGPALELYARTWTDAPADVVQDVFLQLVRQSAAPLNLVPWLYRAVRNAAISRQRSQRRRTQHEQRAATAAPSWFEPTSSDELDGRAASAALAQLDDAEREVIVAHVWGQLTFEQIGALMGSSSSTVHRRYQSGLEKLRKELGIPCSKMPTN